MKLYRVYSLAIKGPVIFKDRCCGSFAYHKCVPLFTTIERSFHVMAAVFSDYPHNKLKNYQMCSVVLKRFHLNNFIYK